MTKKCSKCGFEKEMTIANFARKSTGIGGFDSQCRECKKQYDQVRYQKTKGKCREEQREYYLRNRDARREYQQNYYNQNKEHCHALEKKWRESNPEKRRLLNTKHRALSFGVNDSLTKEDWQEIKSYFHDSCAYCGMSERESLETFGEVLHVEHLAPLEFGGSNSKENIVPSCRACNSSKRNKDFADWYPAYKHYSLSREQKIRSRYAHAM